jgi:predicted Zn-dependent protease
MIDRDAARALLAEALGASAADAAEATLSGGALELTRFAENAIHQNVAERNLVLTIRSIVGAREGSASTNRLDADGIREVARRSEEAARAMPAADAVPDVAEPVAEPKRADRDAPIDGAPGAARAPWGPQERAGAVERIVARARAAGLTAAGYVLAADGEPGEYGEIGAIAVANSRGLFAYHRAAQAMASATMMSGASSGWAFALARAGAPLDVDALAESAVAKAVAARDPKPLPAGRYTVVLEPAPVASLVGFLLCGFNARGFHEGRSFLGGVLPKRIGSDAFSLFDDYTHPMQAGKPFDEEGVPRRRVALVERGEARALVWDRRMARERGSEPTGHGLALPNAEGAAVACPVVPGVDATVDDLIRTTRRGILVTRLWYNRLVDPMRVIVTGMTRDGTYWIEDGRVAHAVRNLRFNEGVVSMLDRITGMSHETLTAASERSEPMVVPALRVEGFHFTSEASF